MPIRGKILNCLKADYNRIFSSEIIIDLLRVLGCGIEISNKHNKDLDSFDLSKLRFNKIIICTDGDVDGQQIRTLILTMVYRLVPTLIYEGKVFIVETPLFEMTFDKNKITEKLVKATDKAVIADKEVTLFAYNDKEKNDILNRFKNKPCIIQRSKGLGENTPEMMWTTTMNPETRILKKINHEDAEKMKKTFDLFLGDNIIGRKKFIEDYGDKYLDLSNLM
jgi:DNA gyrase subunit B